MSPSEAGCLVMEAFTPCGIVNLSCEELEDVEALDLPDSTQLVLLPEVGP